MEVARVSDGELDDAKFDVHEWAKPVPYDPRDMPSIRYEAPDGHDYLHDMPQRPVLDYDGGADDE
jgi:hypothetical protein